MYGDRVRQGESQAAAWPLGPVASCVVAIAIAVLVWAGWRLFWFLTDDAYITFRYARNWISGYGPVWNRPPFLPVEGYTSPLWLFVLTAVWRVTGIAPPRVANVLGLWCGYGTLVFLFMLARDMRLPAGLARRRWPLLAIAAATTLANRTFYTWLSSGLETSLFNLCATACIYYGLRPQAARSPLWARRFALWASLCMLTRPDGGVFLVAAAAQVALALRRERPRVWLGSMWPFALVAAHLVSRRLYYGDWLPNTYYAKTVATWPQAGLRYAGCFLIENGLWVWLLFAVPWVTWRAWRAARAGQLFRPPPSSLTWCALLAHVAFFTLIIGGDHFEYRVYSAWLPLAYLSSVFIFAQLSDRVYLVAAGSATVGLLSLPIPWLHWQDTHQLSTRTTTFALRAPLADDFAPPFDRLVSVWDQWQAWLIVRSVGVRHQEHKVYSSFVESFLPPPARRPPLRWKDRPIVAEPCVGVVGWELPEVAVIDLLGLNDYVIARTPVARRGRRHMAHERSAPPGYVDCFDVNVTLEPQKLTYRPRPLSDDRIRGCERRFRSRLPASTL